MKSPGLPRIGMAEPGRTVRQLLVLVVTLVASGAVPVASQQPVTHKPVLYVIGTSHLDSQWNWTVQDTIREFVPNTFFENFQRIEKYPDYNFNYEGAIHYMWFKEYHPNAWPTLQKYVAQGRWRLAGSWIDAVDVNIPSPESLMRQALYGKRFFRQEFGQVSEDVYLPDCFGFGYALPAIAQHSGLSQFSTQKLTWGSSYGIPFSIGRWRGPDGSTVLAALNPGDYVTKIRSDISLDPKWAGERLTAAGDREIGFRYFGTGDIGGAPDEESIDWLEKSIGNKAGSVQVRNTSSDQLTRDLTPQEKAALPEYDGELTMKTHGVGCYTSQAAMKRFNRENELLADDAERAAVTADLFAGLDYPGERLREGWIRVLWHQFHDDVTGTAIPQAYQFSWNDELVSANQFAGVLTGSVAAISQKLDTQTTGVPLVVYNPLSESRRDPVEATVEFQDASPKALRVVDSVTGRDVPVQILDQQGNREHILFLAEMPPVAFKVFAAIPAKAAARTPTQLTVTPSSLENGRYRVRIDDQGDIASVFDKQTKREMLSAPARLELRDDPSPDKPAWRILWDTVNSPPREFVGRPQIRVVENGPVRVAVEITRQAAGSTFVQRVMVTSGGNRIEVENTVDWKSPNSLLKASFPFTARNARATYDLGLGTIQRGNNTPDHYEVPAQKWADITDTTGTFGTAILNDSKYGWDKPADDILRLTLLHTAKPRAYPYQSSNDLGHHHFTYAIAGHPGDWRDGRVPFQAASLNQPLIAFQTEPHRGSARSISLLSLEGDEDQIAVRALKKSEDSDEVVLRVQELYGRPARTSIKLALPILGGREINAAEEPVGALAVTNGRLAIDLKPYQPRTFALRVQPANAPAMSAVPLELPFNMDGISTDTNRADGDFDGQGQTLAGELLPGRLSLDGVPFKFGSGRAGALNMLTPAGQRLQLPEGIYNRVYVIAAAVGADINTEINGQRVTIREWQGPVGQWDSRLKEPRQLREVSVAPMTRGQSWTADAIDQDLVVKYDVGSGSFSGIDQIRRGFVKREEIAWVGTHRHSQSGNQPYIASYLFVYAIDLPAGTRDLSLPNESRIRIMAITAARAPSHLWPALTLYSADLPTTN
jgi:alpha-mannosidase